MISTSSEFRRAQANGPRSKEEPASTALVDSIEEIQRIVAENKRAEAELLQARADAAQLEREAVARTQAEQGETIAAFASYLDVPPAYTAASIAARLPTLSASVRPLLESVLATMQSGASRFVVAESLHSLAGLELPRLRADDKLLGPSIAKALREMPPFNPKAYQVSNCVDWFEGWVTSVGVSLPSFPHIACEQEHEWNARIGMNMRKGYYSSSLDENYRLGGLEMKLLSDRRSELENKAKVAHHDAMEDLRARLVAIIDPVVASLPFGPAWWWARDFRRVIAREGSRTRAPHLHADPFEAWRQTQILGIKFPFEQLK